MFDAVTHVFHRDPRLKYPVAVRGEGAYLYDRDGKRYLDASGGAAVSCLGHSDPSARGDAAQIDKPCRTRTPASSPPSRWRRSPTR